MATLVRVIEPRETRDATLSGADNVAPDGGTSGPGHFHANQDVTGTAVIVAGNTTVDVTFVVPYSGPRVFTQVQDANLASWAVVNLTAGTPTSFTIHIAAAQATDTTIAYWVTG